MVNQELAVGVDVGGSHIVCAVVDMKEGKLLSGTKFHATVNNKATKEEIFQVWGKTINQTIAASPGPVSGIGFAMPGAFNYKEGIGMFEGNDKFGHLYQVNIHLGLAPYIDGNHPFRFLNDASAFAVGVAHFDQAKGFDRSICITLGTGFGSAYTEFGLPVTDREDVAPHGCFWHLPLKGKIVDDHFSTRWFISSFAEKTGKTVSGVKDISDLADQGDALALGLFENYGRGFGEFMAPWVEKFQPGVIVFGGNIARAYRHFQKAFESELAGCRLVPEIRISNLMEDAALLGGALLFDENYWQKVYDRLPSL